MKDIQKILSAAALIAAISLSGCAATPSSGSTQTRIPEETEIEQPEPSTEINEEHEEVAHAPSEQTPIDTSEENIREPEVNEEIIEERPAEIIQPVVKTVTYIKITASGVNIRKGAGTSFTSFGTAQQDTLFACIGESGEWYKTYYKNNVAYISKQYCASVQMNESSAEIEKIIAEGCKCLGVKYVYGATRYHNGSGKLLSGFTTSEFDCSSLMQYIFKIGANVNLQVNTRTQIYQGETVARSNLKRGDLIFFTNASRQNNKGIERVGHVALYLGDNYILHTSSDFAKIESISGTRWSYYIQAQRML